MQMTASYITCAYLMICTVYYSQQSLHITYTSTVEKKIIGKLLEIDIYRFTKVVCILQS